MIDWAVVFRRQSRRYGRVVDGTCGLFEYMKKGRLKTGSPFSDDVFICFFKDRLGGVFRGQSPRYGFYGCLNTLDGVSDGFLLRRLRVAACVMGLFRRSSETGFGVSDDLFAGVFRGRSPRYGCFSDDLLGWCGFVIRTRAMVVSDDLCRQRASGSVRLISHAFAAPSVSGSRRRRTSAW